MTLKRPETQPTEEALPDALVAIAATLQDAPTAEEVLNRLTRGLSARGVACALFVQAGEGPDFLVERSTLPLTPDVWGRPLRLSRLAAILKRGRPSLESDVAASLSEASRDGKSRLLLSDSVEGPLAAVPLRHHSERGAILCLTASELSRQDLAAAWALGLQLGSALREAEARANVQEPSSTTEPIAEDPPLFHELTQRLSYSLSAQEAIRIGLEVLTPALQFQAASSVACHDGEDTTTVYSPEELPERAATRAAAETLNAFIQLTGEKHRSCQRPQFKTETLAMPARNGGSTGKLESVLDAPLVTGGEVNGLLRIASAKPNAFGAAEERTFFTVANQVSLALERVAAQQQAERAHLASLAESLSDGIILVDAELRVTSLNSAAEELRASLEDGSLEMGATLTDASLAALAREALSSRAATALRELPEADGPAGRRYLVAMAAPLAGSPEGSAAVVILRDVTDERLMQERLLQSEKMVSVGQLVSGVAHEINNPLTGIMGFAQLILLRDLDEQTKSEVNTILTEADRAAKIVQNLLSFARRKRAEKELANLNVLLERVLELRTYELRVKNIEIEMDLDPALPDTMVDATQIQQVMFNIINNAEHAIVGSTDQGVLKVRTSHEKDAIRLSFQDNGAGMSAETVRRIFDPFFTTKETGEGTGLGLTISYGIIDEHGGRIWAESQLGRGTTFIIELPVVAGAGQPAGPPDDGGQTSVTGRSILVVDDEENIRRLLSGILQMDGHHVDTAGNGREALERIGRRRYDMVITDIKMPDMDGRELYQRLLDRDRGLASRTIFITGDTVSSDTRSFLERVRNPCLAKPFRVREVRETIANMLGEAP